ncbi:hypothetical protein [Sphingobacterium deserti]|uniref:Uncharacterized protein n=1 Tax=Sphingobacterium deserti TaxID=1229276 RepID=A0A0B8TCE9_9SPHI|nr:hypothetical protein [Sphingobacterium deserti]KGE16070.1 hypothetical protein DI53_0185 [Sphingobacterium deserti]
MINSIFIGKSRQKHLKIDKQILARYYPSLQFETVDNLITYLDYEDSVSKKKYEYHKFDLIEEDVLRKLDTLFYMVFLKTQFEYENDFLFGMRSIVPKNDFDYNEKSILESKIFFIQHAKEFHVRLLELFLWRNSDLSNVSMTLIKNNSSDLKMPKLKIARFALEKRIIDNEIYIHLTEYLNSPYANAQYFLGKIDEIKPEDIEHHLTQLEAMLDTTNSLLADFKQKSIEENNRKKKVKSDTRAFNIYRGRSAKLAFQRHVYDFVKEYFEGEGLKFENSTRKSATNARYGKLFTYQMLAQLGFIDSKVINRHKTIATRESYIANL